MTTRTRFAIILITAPVLAFALVGGLLGKSLGDRETYPHLRVFDDVFSLTTGNYVEEVDVDRLMHGAMHGLADALDATARTSPPSRRSCSSRARRPAPPMSASTSRASTICGSSPRVRLTGCAGGLKPGDFIRAIGTTPTREMSVWEGMRLLRGAAGTTVTLVVLRGNAVEPTRWS